MNIHETMPQNEAYRMNEAELKTLRQHMVNLRSAIDQAQNEIQTFDDLWGIKEWPKNCCDRPFVFLMLYKLNYRGMRRLTGDVSAYRMTCKKHVWMIIDEIVIDITADQFPDISERVIVTRSSEWHENLTLLKDEPWAIDDEDSLFERHLRNRHGYLTLKQILHRYFPNEYQGWS